MPSSYLSSFLSRFAPHRLLRSRASKRLDALLAELGGDLQALDKTAQAVERRFVAVGELFSKQILLNTEIQVQSDALGALADGQEGGGAVMRQPGALICRTLEFVESHAARTEGLLHHFAEYQHQVRGVRQGKEQLARTLVPLQIIERLFRIESAALPQEMQTAFESLTQEIGMLHQQMRQTLSQQFDAMAETEAQIAHTQKRLRAHAAHLTERAASTREQLEKALLQLDRRVAEARKRDLSLATAARHMADDANQVMTGLQYQDTLRQKSDHIKAALEETLPVADQRPDPTRIHLLCRLQERQLQALRRGLHGASGQIAEGVSQILRQLEEIDRDCLPLSELQQIVDSATIMVETLKSGLNEARSLVALSRQGVEETFSAIASFGGNATNATTTLRQLAQDIKLIAINAQVQAAQMGGGTGLEVLSERTCDLSEQTGRFTRSLGEELDSLIQLLRRVIGECSDTKLAAESRLQALQAEEAPLLDQLDSYQSNTEKTLHRLADLLEQSRRNAQAMQLQNDFSDLSQQPLDALAGTLLTTAECAQSWAGKQASDESTSESLRRLSERYTMDSERAIHAELFGSGLDPEEPSPPEPPRRAVAHIPSAATADNIELF